jgi:putative tricarboxylic transport membrane protein
MILTRRRALGAATLFPTLLSARDAPAQAEWRPTREVEFVIPFAVGGGADLLARVVQKIITDERLVPVSVNPVNRPGGGGAVGMGYIAAQRRGDPHTIVLINSTVQITPINVPNARGLSEIRPIMNIMVDDYVLFVRGDAPWQSAAEVARDAKSRPPRSIAVAGGATDNMAATVFGRGAGIEFNQVVVNSGGEALTQLLGGHVQGMFGNPLEVMGHLQSRTVRALGVMRDTRFPDLPDVPTMREQGLEMPNFQIWRGIAVPRGVPDAPAAYWEGVMRRVVASPAMKSYLKENVASELTLAGAEFERFLANQEALYRDLLGKSAG